jgi:ribosomal protein S18 acetylase RimI-like enzyme
LGGLSAISWVTGHTHEIADTRFVVPEMDWSNWYTVLVDWIVSLGKPFAIGLPLLAAILAVLGYVAVRLGWRIWVIWQWRKRGLREINRVQQLTFRTGTLADVGRIVALVNSAYRGESSRAGWTTEADLLDGQRTDAEEVSRLISSGNSIILLCLQGQKIIGTVHLQYEAPVVYMGMLVIQPDLQGKGTGKKIMRAAEMTAIKMWGVDKMLMYVITLRHELIAYYERRGYHRTGKIKAFQLEARFGVPKVKDLQFELMEKLL